jgi:ribokinase
VLAQLEIPLETVEHLSLICAREGVPLILDPAPARALSPEIFKAIAWFTPNQTEAEFFAGDHANGTSKMTPAEMAALILSKGSAGVVLKMGAEGVYCASANGEEKFIPAFPVKAVDTTAAGDAFNGAFATGLMLGKSALQSAQFAMAVAGISVTRAGAQPSMPGMAEVQQFLEAESAKSHSR